MNSLRQSIAPLRSAATNAAKLQPKIPKRNMSGGGTIEEERAEMAKWRMVTAVVAPAVLAWSGYTIMGMMNHHPEHHETPGYSYLKMMNKRFPWGDGKTGLFQYDH